MNAALRPDALTTVPALLRTIESLPAAERALAQRRVSEALDLTAPAARAALGLLALDLAGDLAPRAGQPAAPQGSDESADEGSDASPIDSPPGDPTVLVLPDLETRLVSATA